MFVGYVVATKALIPLCEYISSLLRWSIYAKPKWNTPYLGLTGHNTQTHTHLKTDIQSLKTIFLVVAIKTVIVKYFHTDRVLQEISC